MCEAVPKVKLLAVQYESFQSWGLAMTSDIYIQIPIALYKDTFSRERVPIITEQTSAKPALREVLQSAPVTSQVRTLYDDPSFVPLLSADITETHAVFKVCQC